MNGQTAGRVGLWLLKEGQDSFVWRGWKAARSSVIEFVADFFVGCSLWGLYGAFALIAHLLIVDKDVVHIVETIHSCSAVVTFSLLGGLGVARVLVEADAPSKGE